LAALNKRIGNKQLESNEWDKVSEENNNEYKERYN
jgi:hypothetical protein